MPLVQITTKNRYHPVASSYGSDSQRMITAFADALPALFVNNTSKLCMAPDTPEAGVQVTHKLFHQHDVNAPDLWILIEFSEGDLTEVQKTKIVGYVKMLILGWFRDYSFYHDCKIPDSYACDVRWSPSHGFLNIDGEQYDW